VRQVLGKNYKVEQDAGDSERGGADVPNEAPVAGANSIRHHGKDIS
jgi:hypothetical protein